ncbi:MAG: holdfast anchoring protein HfaA [Rhizomicrobium sp.]
MKQLYVLAASGLAGLALSSAAHAQEYDNSSDYSHPYGVAANSTNAPVTGSLRDSNGNLELVNGQFLSSTTNQQSGVQNMNPLTGGSLGSSSMSLGSSQTGSIATGGGVGSMTSTGTSTAIGNSLNVVTTGNNDTVIVNSRQTNNGNQTAVATVGGQ